MLPLNSMDSEISVQLRFDILAITCEHAYRIDHGMADTVHELYCVRGELLGLPPKDLLGRDAIAAWGLERVKLARVSRHVETNHRLWWERGVLKGALYATVYRSDSGDLSQTKPFMVGEYQDEYQQESGIWRILRRRICRAFRVNTN